MISVHATQNGKCAEYQHHLWTSKYPRAAPWHCLGTLWDILDRKSCGDKTACCLGTWSLHLAPPHRSCVYSSTNGVFIIKELTAYQWFAATDQEQNWICWRGRMLFDELKLKFKESKFASTVRPGHAPLLSVCGYSWVFLGRECCRMEPCLSSCVCANPSEINIQAHRFCHIWGWNRKILSRAFKLIFLFTA